MKPSFWRLFWATFLIGALLIQPAQAQIVPGNFLPRTGGTMFGGITFNDTGEGLTFHGGGTLTGASGALTLTAAGTFLLGTSTTNNVDIFSNGVGNVRLRIPGNGTAVTTVGGVDLASTGGLSVTGASTLTGAVTASAAAITAGSGTGLTVNNTATVTRTTYKVTTLYTAFSAAALTADKTIATLPAKTRLTAVYADVTAAFTGGAVSDADFTLGNTAGGNQYLVSFDVDGGTGQRGLADADMGTELTRAAAIQGAAVVTWGATTTVTARLTTVGANTDALTAGSITWYLVCEVFP